MKSKTSFTGYIVKNKDTGQLVTIGDMKLPCIFRTRKQAVQVVVNMHKDPRYNLENTGVFKVMVEEVEDNG